MDFQLFPDCNNIGPIPCKTLRYALKWKHGLLSQMNIASTIQDSDGFVVSEKEQSAYLYGLLG